MTRRVSIGLVQHACSEDRSESVARAVNGVKEAARRGAQVICLPELFAGPYFCQVEDPEVFDRAEPLDGPTLTTVAKVAKELRVEILTSVFERRTAGVYHNTLVHIDGQGAQRAVYRKMHIPHDPQFEEKFYFTPGDDGFIASEGEHARLGMLVCWDQWYPEAARLTAMQGAEVLFYPTAIGWMPEETEEHAAQLDAWRTIQRSHAIANGVYVVAVNRVGTEKSAAGSIQFWGHSFVCDPSGRVLAEALEEETVLVIECPLDRIESQRRIWPFFRDRRIDQYQGLLKRWSR